MAIHLLATPPGARPHAIAHRAGNHLALLDRAETDGADRASGAQLEKGWKGAVECLGETLRLAAAVGAAVDVVHKCDVDPLQPEPLQAGIQ